MDRLVAVVLFAGATLHPGLGQPSPLKISKIAADGSAFVNAVPAQLTLTASPLISQPNRPVHFAVVWNRTVVRVNYTYSWGSDPPTKTTETSQDHVFAAPGTYRVQVTATPIESDSVRARQTLSIESNEVEVQVVAPQQPTILLKAVALDVGQNDPVQFTAEPTPVVPGATFHFDFGDNSTFDGNDPRVSRPYPNPGTYTASVIEMDPNGTTLATSPAIQVTVHSPLPVNTGKKQMPPDVKIHVLSTTRIKGQPVEIQATLQPAIRGVRFAVDWGDGTVETNTDARGIASHAYERPGVWTIVATANVPDRDYEPPLQATTNIEVRSSFPTRNMVIATTVGLLILGLVAIRFLSFHSTPERVQRSEVHESIEYRISGEEQAFSVAGKPRRLTTPSISLGPGAKAAQHTLAFLDSQRTGKESQDGGHRRN